VSTTRRGRPGAADGSLHPTWSLGECCAGEAGRGKWDTANTSAESVGWRWPSEWESPWRRRESLPPHPPTVEVAPGVTVSSSGGAHTADDDEVPSAKKTPKKRTDGRTLGSKKTAPPHVTAQTDSVSPADTDATAFRAAPPPCRQTPWTWCRRLSLPSQPVGASAASDPVSFALGSVVPPLLSSFLGAIPGVPGESPSAWISVPAARRQVGATETRTMALAAPAVTTALVADQPPTVSAALGTPVTTTGAVTASSSARDPATATVGVYRQDWTPKASVGVIEAVIDENQAILAGGGGIELWPVGRPEFTDSDNRNGPARRRNFAKRPAKAITANRFV
jgi:hypothetical protein